MDTNSGIIKLKPAERWSVYLIAIFVLYGIFLLFGAYRLGLVENKTTQAFLGGDPELAETRGYSFTLDSASYSPDMLTAIAEVERGEGWQGDGVYDDKLSYAGDVSLKLLSQDHRPSAVQLVHNLRLSEVDFIQVPIYVSGADNYEYVTLDFGNRQLSSYYRYQFNNLEEGWNLLHITRDRFALHKTADSKFDWDSVEKVVLRINSRPDSLLSVNIDSLSAYNRADRYLKDWYVSDRSKGFLNLTAQGKKIMLTGWGLGKPVATLRGIELGETDNFVYRFSVGAEADGFVAAFVHGDPDSGLGYYLSLQNNLDLWEIQKRDWDGWVPVDGLARGHLSDVGLDIKDKYWIKVKREGEYLLFYLSDDGEKYIQVGQGRDTEFGAGGVGISINTDSNVIFDDFAFTKF